MSLRHRRTALITGASSGIGRALAKRLAAEGLNLVLVARNESALNDLARELTQLDYIQTTVIAQDLAIEGSGLLLQTRLAALGIAIDVLVNNAGFGTYGPFETLSSQTEQSEIAVNVSAVVDLCHAFVPGMLARGSGAVLNIASTAAFQPGPYLAVYAATKAFVLSFSEALWAEYRHRGVHVAALCPGPVETAFIDKLDNPAVRQTSTFAHTTTAEHVAEEAVKALRGTAPSRIVGFKHWLLANSIRLVPRALVARSGAGMLKPPNL